MGIKFKIKSDQSTKGAQFNSPAHRAGTRPIRSTKPCKGEITNYFAPLGLTLIAGLYLGRWPVLLHRAPPVLILITSFSLPHPTSGCLSRPEDYRLINPSISGSIADQKSRFQSDPEGRAVFDSQQE
jgi:hypothetical protein